MTQPTLTLCYEAVEQVEWAPKFLHSETVPISTGFLFFRNVTNMCDDNTTMVTINMYGKSPVCLFSPYLVVRSWLYFGGPSTHPSPLGDSSKDKRREFPYLVVHCWLCAVGPVPLQPRLAMVQAEGVSLFDCPELTVFWGPSTHPSPVGNSSNGGSSNMHGRRTRWSGVDAHALLVSVLTHCKIWSVPHYGLLV
jgi:hypothetical protein